MDSFGHKGWRWAVLVGLAVALVGCENSPAHAFPTKPVKIIVPGTPGDTADTIARALAARLSEAWQRPVIVENRPGAGGRVGAEAAMRAPADGYTVIMGNTNSHAINSAVHRNLSYDVLRDFAPISLIATSPSVLVVHPSLPVSNMGEFLKYVRARPKSISFASGGVGSSAHVNGELLNTLGGLRMTHVPYRGAMPAIQDTVAGVTQLMIGNLPPILPFIESGRLRAIAVTSTRPHPALPGVPPIGKTLRGFESLAWFGLFAPAGTPSETIEVWHREVVRALQNQDLKAQFTKIGLTVVGSTPAEYANVVRRDLQKWQRHVELSGAKPF